MPRIFKEDLIFMTTAVSISYNQTVPGHVLRNQYGNRVSQFREPCMKIVSGDADNAKMSFEDAVQSTRGQCACARYIRCHNMNLKARRDGKDVYILRS